MRWQSLFATGVLLVATVGLFAWTRPAEEPRAEEKKAAKQTCEAAGDEAVNGKPAAVYTAHIENQGEVSDNKLWVSKDTGLPLKTEARMQEGTITQTFSYDGVVAPAGVR